MIAGYLATHWADTGLNFQCCSPGWAQELRGRTPICENDRWVAGKDVQEVDGVRTLGILFTRHINAMNGGNEKEQWWLPMSAFKNVEVIFEGAVKLA